MKVTLINPNRFKAPPVPPIGLEHTAAFLENAGHTARIVDLCFSDDIYGELDEHMQTFCPDAAGITIRNVDSVLYHTNEFFLDEIRVMIEYLKSRYGVKTIVGGTGVSTNPQDILEFLGADCAVSGPAEDSLNACLDELGNVTERERIYCSARTGTIHCPRKPGLTDYGKYVSAGGIAGFETHKGCSSSCVYCIEAHTRVRFKEVGSVISELQDITSMGVSHFHLCDSEFNEDLDFSIEFCSALKRAHLDIKWALYMKPANYNQRLFRLMKDTGVYLITLTVDSFRKCPEYWSDIEKMIFIGRSCGISVAVDFLTGFPYEDEEEIIWWLSLFRRLQPAKVNINTYIRLYKNLLITRIILNDDTLKEHLLGNIGDETLVTPVFYNHLSSERLTELIGDDKLFRIEGFEQGVNYLRI